MTSNGDLTEANAGGGPSPSSAEQPTLEAPSRGGAGSPRGLPTEFDDYTLVRLLGRGATGAVYLAEDRLLARHVAIKFVDALDVGDEARARFLNEARAVARVQHPNVIGLYRVGELEGRPYLVTEFARGEPLDRLPVPLPWAKVLAIGIDLARGLSAAHRRGLLHCDVKPQNAILTDEGAKLVDFGLARFIQGRFEGRRGEAEAPPIVGASVAPREVTIRGTPHFMAPELWRGEPPSKRSDVYGLGALLYYLGAGACPFEAVSLGQLARHVQEHDAPPLRHAAPGGDSPLGAIVDRCLRRASGERYASGDELREALERLGQRTVGAPLPTGNPYRGLRAFDADHRAFFFGRDTEARVVLDRLRSEPLLVVTGDSGVGKSSLCRAGVSPAVREGALGGGRAWSVLTFRPGKRPLSALATAVATLLRVDAAKLSHAARAEPAVLADALGRHLRETGALLLFVDQIEELVTVSDPQECDVAEAALAEIGSGRPGLRVLATLRADFLTRFAALPLLGKDLSHVLYFLRPLSPERTREAVIGPATAARLRFESEAMVDELVAATTQPGGLPLLQFALAELWEARDEAAGLIRRSALEAMGGVGGALAKHADALLATLGPALTAEARRLLVRLVTSDDTRVRRTSAELGAGRPAARAALDALVRGRLVVAHEDEGGGAFELAHEVLIREWGALRRWLHEDAGKRAVRERLTVAARDWALAGRPTDALWSARQLREASTLGADDLGERGAEFLGASARAVRRGLWLRVGAAVGLPLALTAAYAGALATSKRDVARRIDARVDDDRRRLEAARAANVEAESLRVEAFRLFDAGERARGEEVWAQALGRAASAERNLAEASSTFETAFAQDPTRADVRALLGQSLYERALLAEAGGAAGQAAEFARRFALYDPAGELARRWHAPAVLSVDSATPGARVALEPASGAPAATRAFEARDLGPTPIAPTPLERGSYLLVLSAPGRATVRYPVLLGRGERAALAIDLPAATAVPAGYLYVPPGWFLFGSAGDDKERRSFFGTAPRHRVHTDGFLIARHEVTYADWIDYLDQLPPAERARRTPSTGPHRGLGGSIGLEQAAGGWRLVLQPLERSYRARAGEAIAYEGRGEPKPQDWLRFPVTGVAAEDALAYAAWLDATGRLPGARLCTEYEWERAARGADGREYPHGDELAPADANYDETYGREAMGPDGVGRHPRSRSPFGVDDMLGNAFEWTRSSLEEGQFVVRGGSYFHDQKTCQSVNRNVAPASLRDAAVGLRVCAAVASLAERGAP
ncbi:MAG: SUMF1/EgtB/PvdO family nonheme iron enzyme [Polyangiaceae bacterium]|jgi:formylglycine-generating enzyme required for sulfatase activity|nr:SUMF1/EgtB/PvdO family nonheme iron enzyme [Polyangiaceae bacterium]